MDREARRVKKKHHLTYFLVYDTITLDSPKHDLYLDFIGLVAISHNVSAVSEVLELRE